MQPRQSSSTVPANELPAPDALSRRHSERVSVALRDAMLAAGGSLSFGEFMQFALYAPGLGYYVAGSRKFGADGDFVTAAEISPLFGKVIARQLAPLIADGSLPAIVEAGPGSGALAVHVLAALAELDALPEQYFMLEVSPELRERQAARIDSELPQFADRVDWLAGWPDGFTGIVLANEVADALPVERFRRSADGVEQLHVRAHGEGFVSGYAPAPGWLCDAVEHIESSLGHALPEGYESELSPGLAGWLGELGSVLSRGLVLLFDYGLARPEYYAAERSGGWLRCHFRHRAHNDPLILPGIQDLTAWVDFTAVAEAAVNAGLDVLGYVTQSRFMLDGGLACEMAAVADLAPRAQIELSRQVKLLTLPAEMGEHFKCIGLARGAFPVPEALSRGDRSHAL